MHSNILKKYKIKRVVFLDIPDEVQLVKNITLRFEKCEIVLSYPWEKDAFISICGKESIPVDDKIEVQRIGTRDKRVFERMRVLLKPREGSYKYYTLVREAFKGFISHYTLLKKAYGDSFKPRQINMRDLAVCFCLDKPPAVNLFA